jgi:hypothetical protein
MTSIFQINEQDCLPEIWRESSSGYLKRAVIVIYVQYEEDYFPEAIYSEKYGTVLPWSSRQHYFLKIRYRGF